MSHKSCLAKSSLCIPYVHMYSYVKKLHASSFLFHSIRLTRFSAKRNAQSWRQRGYLVCDASFIKLIKLSLKSTWWDSILNCNYAKQCMTFAIIKFTSYILYIARVSLRRACAHSVFHLFSFEHSNVIARCFAGRCASIPVSEGLEPSTRSIILMRAVSSEWPRLWQIRNPNRPAYFPARTTSRASVCFIFGWIIVTQVGSSILILRFAS